MIGAVVLVGVLSTNAGAQPPTVVAPVTGFRPVPTYNAPQGPVRPSEESTAIPGPYLAPEPSYTPRPTPTDPLPKAVTPKPKPKPRLASGSIRGVATWYCLPGRSRCTHGYAASGNYGAAGPELRAALGHWRGKHVFVNGVEVILIDFCACGGDHVIDVYHSTWVRIPHPNHAKVTW